MIRCVIPEELAHTEIVVAFQRVMSQGQGLLPGCRVVLDFGARPLTEEVVSAILSGFIFPSGVEVAAWITYDAASQDALKRVGFSTAEPVATPQAESQSAMGPGLILHRSLRSGQRVEHRGDVIIAGHVNDGAEVLASGNVTILGRLNGLVHAGYEGNEGVAVVARSMEALQVRIGGKIGSLERGAMWWGKSVIAKVEDDTVLIDYWPTIKRGKTEGPTA